MTKNTLLIFNIFLFFMTPSSYAQLILRSDISPRSSVEFIRSVQPSEFQNYIDIHGATDIRKYGRLDKTGLTAVTSRTEYKWSFKKIEFFSYVKAFRTDLIPPPRCLQIDKYRGSMNDSECQDAVSMFRQCHLFLIDASRKLIAVQPLHIPQPDFIEAKPGCFDVYAMAPAKVVKDGMLIVAGYYDSRWTCFAGPACASDGPAASPDPLYKTTFLLRFSKGSDGKLVLRQDDACLSPLNDYATIARARRALIENGCQ